MLIMLNCIRKQRIFNKFTINEASQKRKKIKFDAETEPVQAPLTFHFSKKGFLIYIKLNFRPPTSNLITQHAPKLFNNITCTPKII